MAVEFGAKLYLKDNMYATLKKNLGLQREFSEQIGKTNASMQQMGRTRVNATINATDNASGVVESVRQTVNSVGNTTVSPEVSLQDNASGVIGAIQDTLDTVNTTTATPEVEVEDNASPTISEVESRVHRLGNVRALTRAEVDDQATEKVERITQRIKDLTKKVFSPVIKLKDLTVSTVGKIKQRLKEIATTFTPIVKIRDLASQGLAKIKNTLGGLRDKVTSVAVGIHDRATSGLNKIRVGVRTVGKLVAKPFISVRDKATSGITKVRNSLKSVGKTVAKPFVTLRDKASAPLGKVGGVLKSVGKTVAKPFIAVKDGASKILHGIGSSLKSIGNMSVKAMVAVKDGASAVLGKIGSTLKSLAKGVTIAVGIAGAGATALMGKSLGEGAKLQQSIGGVETLYTKTNSDGSTDTSAVDKMLQYANQAYKTTGLSANEYMENVTSFSASLLSACAGDTNKSAEIANKAMIDMADNANKMGTDMGSIQNAYQGFAKQNYTMLDNLKLGYGGTKEEMDRLLKDAQAITGTKYDINNLADVYTAIGVIQDKLNITGTTAREAEQTFSGSFAMMKASVTNLLGNLSIGDGEAVARSMGELVESASTFFFGNFIPMLQTTFSNLPTAIGTAVEKVAPQIKENVLPLLTSIKDAIFTGLGNIGIDTGALQAIFDQLFNVKVDGGGIASMFSCLKDGIVQAINTILPIIPPIISALTA